MDCTTTTTVKIPRKRKPETPGYSERLSKRLSLLNLERNKQKLYVPVEQPLPVSKATVPSKTYSEDVMQLCDSKHKVYIYDLDAELSDTDSDDGKLVFLPDIEKQLRKRYIPPSVLPNKDGDLGNNQLVLYSIPSSLTVPEEQDSVRKAVIETRARTRAKKIEPRIEEMPHSPTADVTPRGSFDSRVSHIDTPSMNALAGIDESNMTTDDGLDAMDLDIG